MTTWLISAHIFTTLSMTGIIWFIQIVHYPLFQKISSSHFVDYEINHTRLTGYLVMPLMVGELITGCVLTLIYKSQNDLYLYCLLYAGMGLIVINWFVTLLFFVPIHRSLSREFNLEITRRLIALNWLRTIIWSSRSIIVLAIFTHNIK